MSKEESQPKPQETHPSRQKVDPPINSQLGIRSTKFQHEDPEPDTIFQRIVNKLRGQPDE